MALSDPGKTENNNRGSMKIWVGIVANDPGTTTYNYRGSMMIYVQTAEATGVTVYKNLLGVGI